MLRLTKCVCWQVPRRRSRRTSHSGIRLHNIVQFYRSQGCYSEAKPLSSRWQFSRSGLVYGGRARRPAASSVAPRPDPSCPLAPRSQPQSGSCENHKLRWFASRAGRHGHQKSPSRAVNRHANLTPGRGQSAFNFDPTPDGSISRDAIRERGLNGGWLRWKRSGVYVMPFM
jgi:hypothetical protein